MEKFKPVVHKYEATVADFFVNAFLVETENKVVAVDATIAKSSAVELRRIIDEDIKKPLEAVLVTHGHPDHFTGLVELTKGLDVPIFSTQGTLDFAKSEDKVKAPTAVQIFGGDYPKERIFPNEIVKDGFTVTYDNATYSLKDLGPAESDDDSIWELDIDGIKHVFLGDVLHNNMHCFLRDGHITEWIKQLEWIANEYDHSAVVYTGHGDICGTEMAHWHKGYIEAFLGSLKTMLGDRDSLTDNEKNLLISKMTTFLPNEKCLFLLEYELDSTIKLLRDKGIL